MNIRDVGERGIISLIHRLQASPPIGYIGIGDDAAYLPPSDSGWLISQDMLVENIHFRWDWMTPYQLGIKAVAVNMSDIAAMGGSPKAILTSISLPSTLHLDAVEDIYRGMAKALDQYDSVLVGGDTVGSLDGLVVDVTVVGQPGPQGPMRKTGARPGDRIMVTGRLGAAHAGLALLEHGVHWPGHTLEERSVLVAQLAPQARVDAGYFLGQKARALTDVSDGLYEELREMTGFGGIGAKIYGERLPIDEATRTVASRFHADPLDYVLYGGEDYELLAVVPASRVSEIEEFSRRSGTMITEIGVITDVPGIRLSNQTGEMILDGQKSFNHFAVDSEN